MQLWPAVSMAASAAATAFSTQRGSAVVTAADWFRGVLWHCTGLVTTACMLHINTVNYAGRMLGIVIRISARNRPAPFSRRGCWQYSITVGGAALCCDAAGSRLAPGAALTPQALGMA